MSMQNSAVMESSDFNKTVANIMYQVRVKCSQDEAFVNGLLKNSTVQQN